MDSTIGIATGRPSTAEPEGVAGVGRLRPDDALLVVDLQRDFLPGGALAVAGGDEVVAPLSALAAQFAAARRLVVASRDWHPPDHCSFASRGGPWPKHCVAGSEGAAFAPGFTLPYGARVVSKGYLAGKEAYSAFDGTGLAASLLSHGVRRLFVGGLATDYCVRASVLDALQRALEVVVLTDAVRAVNRHPGDGDRALEEMRRAGAQLAACAALA